MRVRPLKISVPLERLRAPVCVLLVVVLAMGGGCFSGDESEQFYGLVKVPRAQEFRWSDGGLPRVFDPARAASPPDTNAVRALFEGLTELDPQSLRPVAGVAARWESSEGERVWTFHLRDEARWSNGDPVTAQDFVRAWRRTFRLGEDAPHARLLANLIEKEDRANPEDGGGVRTAAGAEESRPAGDARAAETQAAETARGTNPAPLAVEPKLGVEALDEQTLRVRLQRPDRNFAALVAHPVFRPVHASAAGDGAGGIPTESGDAASLGARPVISNGAFRLSELAADRVVLERERNYWNVSQVALERVSFVGGADTEAALSAYRAGEVDAVTNANVEPLGLKLLASYKDFRRTTFGALTYYDINASRPPFDDVRVRRALALALDRRRLSGDTLEGATEPAEKFLPDSAASPVRQDEANAQADEFGSRPEGAGTQQPGVADAGAKEEAAAGRGNGSGGGGEDDAKGGLGFDPARARRLFAEAGYAGGAGFPRVRLLVNRNDQHRLVARAVADMWRGVLGVETEIMLRDWGEYETLLRTGEFDVAKRSLIMQSPDEEANMLALFDPERLNFDAAAGGETEVPGVPTPGESRTAAQQSDEGRAAAPPTAFEMILTEAQALREVPAIPVYFASSNALVKPYVQGFDSNLLDAPSLQRVRMDTNWQPPKRETLLSPVGRSGR